ncbi:VanW family protein [Intestinibacter bartlettii]|uniref:VanW family protein n=1 Tax=Intestinibacter bartlettii TaxID=261299 RepID=A0ABS6DZH8_9FIRM|nr:VanW family protein [Intestinibacter bartlettii]MBU5337160.1 VanW family protein [Intestinibacter bartlettii]
MSEDTATKGKGSLKSKRNVIILIIAAIIIAFVWGLNHLTSKHLYNGKIGKNIYIEDVDVSNLTKQEALDTVNAKYPVKNLKLSYNNKEYTINAKDVDLSYNTKELVDDAYNLTRDKSYLSNIMTYISTKFGGHDYIIKASYDEDKLDKQIGQVSKQINKHYVDATLSVSSGITIKESQTGLKCDDEANKKAIKKAYKEKDYNTIALKVDVTQPKVKTEDLQSIDTVLGSFATTFNGSQYGRNYNIALALSRCDGTVVMPGETFSYNDATGPRVVSNGFKYASVIVAGDYQDAPGGGVCQGSTTLFNAVLLSGLEITQVRNHSRTANYVPRGRDAMVNDGDSDFKFTNNFDHPVYIAAYAGGGSASAQIYGSSKDKVGVSIKTTQFTYSGLPGAKTYRTITKNGKSETTQIYTAVYKD